MVNKFVLRLALVVVGVILMAGCTVQETPLDDLFPPQVGDYLRIDGPKRDPDHALDQATYKGPDGAVLLRVKFVGRDQTKRALDGLPLAATNVGPDPALGQRSGTFFNFDSQFHAAWGNGDWVFVISAPTEMARVAFLAGYGF